MLNLYPFSVEEPDRQRQSFSSAVVGLPPPRTAVRDRPRDLVSSMGEKQEKDKLKKEEPKKGDLQFEWGLKRGVGGLKKDVQFYESFTFDEVDYRLYDSVYLFKRGETEPYIGKIVKIWEHGEGKKKVKILWFFKPSEIVNYLGDYQPSEKEIFLASGEGVGLANINPLESIAAKCSVICTSEDTRNPQPSKDALQRADFLFSRTFDVGKFIISDKLPEKIAGIEVKSLLNREDDQVRSPVSITEENGTDIKGKADAGTASIALSNSENLKSEENKVKIDKPGPTLSSKDKAITKKRQAEVEGRLVGTSVTKSKIESSRDIEGTNSFASNDKPSKKMRISDDSAKPDDLRKNKHATDSNKSDEDDSAKGSISLHKENVEKMKLIEKKVNSSSESLQNVPSAFPVKNNTKAESQMVEVSRRPDTDRSKWFKGLSWESRIQKAHEQGTLVLLHNFDRSFTSTEIEDIMYHYLNLNCSAKVIPRLPPYHNPHYGEAYVVFKSRDAANEAVQKINTGCLMDG
ncbi:uncharacterized protein A4U43_C03F17410, partial [Asparagus officinalis]